MSRLFLIGCVLLLCATHFAHASEDDADVVVLTSANFQRFISAPISLVEFYAPWCGHCKNLKPEYGSAATQLLKHDTPVPLGKVDATEEPTIANQYGVRGYPTLKIFRNGTAADFNGGRTADTIVTYMKSQTGPGAVTVASKAEVEKLIEESTDKPVVVFFPGNGNSPAVFRVVADQLRDSFKFVEVSSVAVAKEMGHSESTVAVYRSTDPLNEGIAPALIKAYDQESLNGWLYENFVDTIGKLSSNSRALFTHGNKPLFYLFADHDADSEEARALATTLRETVRGLSGNSASTLFAYASRTEFKTDAANFNLDAAGPPLLAIDDSNSRSKYRMDGSFSAAGISSFLRGFYAGRLTKHYKSEPVPSSKKAGEVAQVVGMNFQDVVLDKEKDVLLEIYAPWCGHCKKLEPIYADLAQHYKRAKNVVIAKVDGTANDIPDEYRASGFPTLYMAPANNKHAPVKYSGDRDLESLIAFVDGNAAKSAKKPKKKQEL